MPNSTKCFTDSVFGNKPKANGPKRRPTKKYAIVEEILRYLKTATAATELTSKNKD